MLDKGKYSEMKSHMQSVKKCYYFYAVRNVEGEATTCQCEPAEIKFIEHD